MSEDKNIQYGWVCPLCGKANAPWNRDCSCANAIPKFVPNRIYDPVLNAPCSPCDFKRVNGPIKYTYPTYEVTCNG